MKDDSIHKKIAKWQKKYDNASSNMGKWYCQIQIDKLKRKLKRYQMKQLLYFSAPWCGPCRALGPILDELSSQYSIKKINIDNQPEVAREYGITSIPTTILLEDGKEKERKIGPQSKSYYINLFK